MLASHLVMANVLFSEEISIPCSDKLDKNLYQKSDTDISNIQSGILPSLIQQLGLVH